MTPAKSAVRRPSGGIPVKGSPFKRRRRPINPRVPHGRPAPGPRKPKPDFFKGTGKDPRRDPVRRKARFRNQRTNQFKKRRIRNRFTRTRTRTR